MVSCQYVDKLLSDIERVLNQSSSSPLFKTYRDDISPVQRKLTHDYIARIRARIGRALEGQSLSLPPPDVGAIHSISTTLKFIDIAVEEFKPKYMRGYGEVPESAVAELNGIVSELQGLVQRLISSLGKDEADLAERLARFESTHDEIELLKTLARIVQEHGIVELRQTLSMLAERFEEDTYEIAVFGRVSSGKSSLLNRIIDVDLLPVGVNPITAVPTRIFYGPEALLRVWFADRQPRRLPVGRLVEFAAEQNNPANSRHIVRLVVETPSPRLREGIVLVDTPGLGSLATSGAAETLAYLPRCDLGVVLVDAGSTLTVEDVSTVRMLYEAGTPALVLLSKADLIRPDDRRRAAQYIGEQFKMQLGLDLTVQAISALESHGELLERWFDEHVQPLYDQHHQLAQASLRRKIGSLRDSVRSALDLRLSRDKPEAVDGGVDAKAIETELRREEGELEHTSEVAQRFARDLYFIGEMILTEAAERILDRDLSMNAESPTDLVASVLNDVVVEKIRPLLEAMNDSARRLGESLANIEVRSGAGDAPTPDELIRGIREMPRFAITLSPVDIDVPALWWLGRSTAKRRMEARLRNRIGDQFSKAISAYSGVLESWTRRTFEEIKRRFSSYADAYRAELEQISNDSGGSPADADGLRRDLDLLDRWEVETAASDERGGVAVEIA
jgi:GTP-binding protein EngB required for normal cell division